MIKKKSVRKLCLNRETLRSLRPEELSQVEGGTVVPITVVVDITTHIVDRLIRTLAAPTDCISCGC